MRWPSISGAFSCLDYPSCLQQPLPPESPPAVGANTPPAAPCGDGDPPEPPSILANPWIRTPWVTAVVWLCHGSHLGLNGAKTKGRKPDLLPSPLGPGHGITRYLPHGRAQKTMQTFTLSLSSLLPPPEAQEPVEVQSRRLQPTLPAARGRVHAAATPNGTQASLTHERFQPQQLPPRPALGSTTLAMPPPPRKSHCCRGKAEATVRPQVAEQFTFISSYS